MPENKEKSGMFNRIDKLRQDLFKHSYYGTPKNQEIFDKTNKDITSTIKNIIKKDGNYSDISNTTRLFEKIVEKNSSGKTNVGDRIEDISSIFGNVDYMSGLINTYSENRFIKLFNNEIDMCLKHMPKLKQAIDIQRDNVLCADNFSKSFLNIYTINGSTSLDNDISDKLKRLIKDYDIESKIEQYFINCQIYGEEFVWCVPYKKALSELLYKKNTNINGSVNTVSESFLDNKIQLESATGSVISGIRLSINNSTILNNIVKNISDVQNILSKNMCRSIYTESLEHGFDSDIINSITLSYDNEYLLKNNKDNSSIDDIKSKLKVNGCIIKSLEPEYTYPIYIEDILIGYYYIKPTTLSNTNEDYKMSTLFGPSMVGDSINNNQANDEILKSIASQISENIDLAFINNNVELKKEIYMMLKYNDIYNDGSNIVDMNVSFIPAEDIIHFRYKENPKTHRGISELYDGIIPAKLWIMLNTTTALGNATRGQDKRVYYVKNQVDTNVSRTLMNVVDQIKRGNFGIRQIESINNVLGILGKFNDFVIPVGPSGDSPVQFDILQGQTFELPQDQMQALEESAISSIMPIEIVNSANNIEFAIRYTMTNGRLLRDILKTQSIFEKHISKFITKIYNCEYEENVSIEMRLPIPTYLMLTQTSQIIQTTTGYLDPITEIEMSDIEDDKIKALFKQKYMRKLLNGYVDYELIDNIKKEINAESIIKDTENNLNNDDQ